VRLTFWGNPRTTHRQFPQSKIQNPKSKIQNPNSQFPLFWIPLSLEAYRPAIEAAIERYGLRARIVSERTEEVLAAADFAIAKSGTVNLELTLLDVPQVVFYRVSPVTHAISRLVQFSMPFMSPPNLVVMRSVVPELFQGQATPDNIVREALPLLFDPQKRQRMLEEYQDVRHRLGEVGVCDRAAREILQRATASKTSDQVQSG
jgi:lipid-A-disaccharide synthase